VGFAARARRFYRRYWGDFRRDQRAMLVFVFLGLALTFGAIGASFLPYGGVTVHSLRAEEARACPDTALTFVRDYTVEPSVTAVDVEPYWIAVDVPGVRRGSVLGTGSEIPYTEGELVPGRKKGRSSVLLSAPLMPGLWLPASDTTVYGAPYEVPLSDTRQVRADEPVLILSPKECEDA